MSTMEINSHIQMPRCVLQRFENSQKSFFYFDVVKKIIGTNGHAKSINTEKGYYSKDTEDFLNNEIENPFSRMLQAIDQINFDESTFQLDNNLNRSIKSFIYALIARDPIFFSGIKQNSVLYQLLPEQNQHDYAAVEGIQLALENGYFGSYHVTFTINKTTKPFVLPICGIYDYEMNGIKHINLPISSQVAITLIEPKGITSVLHDDVTSMYLIEKEKMIDWFNGRAFERQYKSEWGFVVSSQKEILEELYAKIIDSK